MVQPSDDPDWFENSKVASEDALKKVQVAWSKSLEERSPAIATISGQHVSRHRYGKWICL